LSLSDETKYDLVIDVSTSLDDVESERCAMVPVAFLVGEAKRIRCISGTKGRFVKIAVHLPKKWEVHVYGFAGMMVHSQV